MAQVDPRPSAVGGPSTVTNAAGPEPSTRLTPSGERNTPLAEPLPRPFGRYELRRLLGRGGMGSVYLAHDAQLDRDVALKIPRPFGDDPNLWRERFLTEARAAATLSHPNICPVHDVGELDGRPFLTMAYIDGETLASKLRTAGRLPVAEAVEIVTAVARAMADAHARGIVHRDLKPGNVMIDRRGRPVVMDFGLALRTDAADDLRVTLTGVALGTPAYMSPEQAGADVDAIGPPADVYALGVMLFELTTGQTPFKGKTFGKLLAQIERDPPPVPSSLNPDIHPALDGVILTALAKAPADRFPTAAELADVLDQFLAGRHDDLAHRFGAAVTAAHPDDLQTRAYPAPPRKRTGWLPAVAAGLFGLLVLLAGAIYVSTDKGDLKVEFLDPDTGKPIPAPASVDVKINGQRVVLDPDGKPITVRAGDEQMLVVTGDDFVTESRTFTLKRWKDATVQVTLIPKDRLAKRADDKPKVDGPKAEGKLEPAAVVKPTLRHVEYPKDKTLIEAGGWQILADATQEQTQAWLDEKKKAKHSVLWLDAIEVAGRPLFCGLAAPDDRFAGGWHAFFGIPAAGFTDAMKAELGRLKLDTKRCRPAAVCGYFHSGKVLTASLFHPNEPSPWFVHPYLSRADLPELDMQARRAGQGYSQFRPYPAQRGATYFVAITDPSEKGGEKGYDLSADGLNRFADDTRAAGLRVSSVSAYVDGEDLKFAAVNAANPNKWEWLTDTGMTAAELTAKAAAQAKQGYHPDSVTAYPWDGAVRYCVVWVKEPPKPVEFPKDKRLIETGGWQILCGATREQMRAWLDEKKKAGHSVTWLDVCEVDRKPLFSAVAAQDDRAPKWKAVLEMPSDAFRDNSFAKQIDLNAEHPVAGSGYGEGKVVRTATLWVEGVQPAAGIWDATDKAVKELIDELPKNHGVIRGIRPYPVSEGTAVAVFAYRQVGEKANCVLNASVDDADDFVRQRREAGERVASYVAYPKDGKLLYAVLSAANPDKMEWRTDRGMTDIQLNEAIATQAKAGFRPHSITACPWDGAVRYCVVWVKDPPAKDGKPAEKK